MICLSWQKLAHSISEDVQRHFLLFALLAIELLSKGVVLVNVLFQVWVLEQGVEKLKAK